MAVTLPTVAEKACAVSASLAWAMATVCGPPPADTATQMRRCRANGSRPFQQRQHQVFDVLAGQRPRVVQPALNVPTDGGGDG